MIATDAEGRITFVNPVAEALTGWKAEEAAGQPIQCVFRIVNEQTGQPLEEPVARVLREGRAVELANHTALVTKDGRTVPIEDSAAPILDAAGQVIGVVLVFHDVTEKRRAEEALLASRGIGTPAAGRVGRTSTATHGRSERADRVLCFLRVNERLTGSTASQPATTSASPSASYAAAC